MSQELSPMERARQLLQKHKEQQENRAKGNTGSYDQVLFPFWSMKPGNTATLRFLPDADPNNPFFWYDRCTRKIPFTSVVGMEISKPVNVTVPAYNLNRKDRIINLPEECKVSKALDPIHDIVQSWFNDDREMYNKYQRSWQSVMQCFVRNDGGVEKDLETPVPFQIRRVLLTLQLWDKVYSILEQVSIKHFPTHYEFGRDFNIRMNMKGEFKNYDSSSWDFDSTSLTEQEAAYLAENELYDLKKFIPVAPTADESKIMFEMFEASVEGRPYDPKRWGEFFKPAGLDISSAMLSGRTTVEMPAVKEEEAPKTSASDILNRLKPVQVDDEPETAPSAAVVTKPVTNSALAALLAKKNAAAE